MIGRNNAKGRDREMIAEISQEEELPPKLCRCLNASAACFTHRDRISKLPDEVLDFIMSRVSLRDRIRASVISRRWNEICLSPSRIQFHWHQGLVNVANCDRYEHFCPMYRDAFVNIVNRFLASFRGNHRDRISELPDEVLDLIMLKISLRDRVRASVVSQRWSKICLSPSEIRLDWANCLATGNTDSDDEHNHDEFCPFYREVFVNNVNRFLSSFRGSHVKRFDLRFCLTRSSKNDMDGWIRFAVRRGVQSMSFISFCYTGVDFRNLYGNDPGQSFEDIQYMIGTELFDTARCNLKSLLLGGCNLGPDFAKHLRGLKTLNLAYSFLAHYDMQTLFSGLPNLLELIFSRCNLPVELSLSCLPLLRTFTLKHCSGVQHIYLHHVNLSCFQLFTERVVKCDLVRAPNVVSLGCSATRMTLPYFFNHIPIHAPMLTKLHVICHGELDDCVPRNLKVFSRVMRLEWYFKPNSRLGIVKMINILKAFPLLRVLLVVTSNAKNLEENHQLMDVSYKPEDLSVVILGRFCGTSTQINFVAYLLKHATKLKRFIIRGQKTWGEAARQDFLSKIEGFDKGVEVIVS